MATKLKAPAKLTVRLPLPTPEVYVYVAEDFREEAHGTVTAVGLYTARSLVVNVAEGAVFSKEKPVVIHSLSFLIAMKGFIGPKNMAFSFTVPSKPDEFTSTRTQQHTFNSTSEGVNMIIRGQPFLLYEFGRRSLVVDVGDFRKTVHFEILRGNLPLPAKV